jgi:DNA-binding XRE family transcriptional regulator
MFPTVLLVTDRPQFEDAWRSALVELGMSPRSVRPETLAQNTSDASVATVAIDAACSFYDEDELLSAVGLCRALGLTTAVSLPEGRALAGIEELLEDLCCGLLVRPAVHEQQAQAAQPAQPAREIRRIAQVFARKRDSERAKRFEYLTVSPRPNELLAVLGDASALLLPRPVSEQDDGSEVESITLDGDAQSAKLKLGSGRELSLRASAVAPVNGKHASTSHARAGLNGANAMVAIDGARLGARLRELRLAAGLTQAELARRTGIHRPNIARVEAGRHTPSLETLSRLASAIGVSTTVVLADS